jgi:hypothetical protein
LQQRAADLLVFESNKEQKRKKLFEGNILKQPDRKVWRDAGKMLWTSIEAQPAEKNRGKPAFKNKQK